MWTSDDRQTSRLCRTYTHAFLETLPIKFVGYELAQQDREEGAAKGLAMAGFHVLRLAETADRGSAVRISYHRNLTIGRRQHQRQSNHNSCRNGEKGYVSPFSEFILCCNLLCTFAIGASRTCMRVINVRRTTLTATIE
jgi:hypothetical protein